jgi:OHCU decarboxylase
MRSHPAEYELVSPATLDAVLRLLHSEPGQWSPVAGATEVMVMFSAGKLATRRLVNVGGLPELRVIAEDAKTLTLGGGCTFSQIRSHATVQKHFPLLAQAASWTGSIANQNRATIGGNLANASPAADSPPSLLAYDAEVELVSVQGTRLIPYRDFHLAYKKTALAPTELIRSLALKKPDSGTFSYGRKTGARNAQAVSKVCIAGVGRMRDGRASDVRIGIGAVAPTPLRLYVVESVIEGHSITEDRIADACRALQAEIAPIDDIRSVADYRRWVAGNLIEEFLRALAGSAEISPELARWNALAETEAAQLILPCCGSTRWARELTQKRPFASAAELVSASDRVWEALEPVDWEEAFRTHPQIGKSSSADSPSAHSATWSRKEQAGVDAQDAATLDALARGNVEYEARFGRVFLICATGKSAAEMLGILHERLGSDEPTELREAVEQQRQIAQLRLRRWLGL